MKLLILLVSILTISSCSSDKDVQTFTDNTAIVGDWVAKYPDDNYNFKRIKLSSRGEYINGAYVDALDPKVPPQT
ncbi:MAG: hypothetical protein FDW93_02175 [Bergeyella sp.]|nr:hypothetical protein [Bergeyella sp.]